MKMIVVVNGMQASAFTRENCRQGDAFRNQEKYLELVHGKVIIHNESAVYRDSSTTSMAFMQA